MKKLAFLLLALLLLTGIKSYAQSSDYMLIGQSTLTINGTSTLHDWECDVEDFSLESKLADSPSAQPFVEQFKLSSIVKSIECGKRAMNKKTYGALKEKDHPTISFVVTNASVKGTPEKKQAFTLNVKGNLTIAGVTKPVSFPVKGQLLENNQYRFEGSYDLNMKDYEVDPPSAIFGTIRAGEEVEVGFSLTLAKSVRL